MKGTSPYAGVAVSHWSALTRKLVKQFPLSQDDIVSSVHRSWVQLFSTRIGGDGLQVGVDIFLPAQATGVILEKLIARDLGKKHRDWRSGQTKLEKDVVCISDDYYSFEIKTSSSTSGLYGNRSTGNLSAQSKKKRSGYYLVINYKLPSETDHSNAVRLIRFGWIDDVDWIGQASASGQQASVSKQIASAKLVTFFPL